MKPAQNCWNNLAACARNIFPLRFVIYALAGALVLTGCDDGVDDWSAFTVETIQGSLEALAEAELLYVGANNAFGVDSACARAVAYLADHPAVDSAGIEEDSTVWAEFSNGLSGSIVETTWGKDGESLFYLPRADAPIQTSGGGEATPSCVILAPFTDELPGTEPGPIRNWLDTCFGGPEPATEVVRDAAVTVDKVREVLQSGTGMLIWAGHGFLRKASPGSTDKVCALITGESFSEAQRAAGDIKDKYGDQVKMGSRYLTVAVHRGRWYLAILPGFVSAHGNFDVLEGLGVNQSKSLAYISCCYSLRGMRDAFIGAGTDVYWGWTWASDDSFAGQMDRAMFRLLTDTCTAGEATGEVRGSMGHNSPSFHRGRRARFYMAGDSAIMIRAQMRMKKDGSDQHGYSVGVVVDDVTMVNCFAGQPLQEPEYGVTVHFPGTSAGSFDCVTQDDAEIAVVVLAAGKGYLVSKDYKGVSGTIDVERYDEKVISGRFSGTLGYWSSNDPTEFPPDETIEIQDGSFKHTGLRQ